MYKMWYLFCSDLENISLLFSLRIYIWKNMYTLVMWCIFLFCFFFSVCMNLLCSRLWRSFCGFIPIVCLHQLLTITLWFFFYPRWPQLTRMQCSHRDVRSRHTSLGSLFFGRREALWEKFRGRRIWKWLHQKWKNKEASSQKWLD